MKYKIINPESIQQSMMGNTEMIKQFVQMYLSQTPADFEALSLAVNNKNHQAIKDAAHHIKPTMEYIGASQLRADFQELENLGKDLACVDLIVEKFGALKPKFDLMLEELKTLL